MHTGSVAGSVPRFMGEVRGCSGNQSAVAPELCAAGRLQQEAQGIPGSRDPVRVLGSWCSPLGQEELVTQYTRTLVHPCSVVVPFKKYPHVFPREKCF